MLEGGIFILNAICSGRSGLITQKIGPKPEIQSLDNYNGVEVFVDLVGGLDINDAKQFKSASNLNIIKNRPKPLKT